MDEFQGKHVIDKCLDHRGLAHDLAAVCDGLRKLHSEKLGVGQNHKQLDCEEEKSLEGRLHLVTEKRGEPFSLLSAEEGLLLLHSLDLVLHFLGPVVHEESQARFTLILLRLDLE